MADSGQKSEQPTPRRLEKARKEGQFPVSREFVSGLVFLLFVWLVTAHAADFFAGFRSFGRTVIELAFTTDLSAAELHRVGLLITRRYLMGFVIAAAMLWVLGFSSHLITTGFGFAAKKLMPDFSRLNPGSRLSQMPSQNFSSLVQAVILLPLFGWIVWRITEENLPAYLSLPRLAMGPALHLVGSSVEQLLWRAAGVLVVLGCIDLFRQRRRWSNQIRMTKQEVREEQKEAEGNPLVRMRLRRLQRELVRRRMMQQVPQATAVVVNPTHFAVALRYDMDGSGAPKVVAKGKNWLALKIREVAIRNQVPIIENPPLAQALYKSVQVGQEIPPHLYKAVAEVLAYIYRLMGGRLSGAR